MNVSQRSSVKALAELLQHYLLCNNGTPTLSQLSNVDESILRPFYELSMDATMNAGAMLGEMTKNLKLSQPDKGYLLRIVDFYAGEMTHFAAMLTFSQKL
jgi:hypothetical protein